MKRSVRAFRCMSSGTSAVLSKNPKSCMMWLDVMSMRVSAGNRASFAVTEACAFQERESSRNVESREGDGGGDATVLQVECLRNRRSGD